MSNQAIKRAAARISEPDGNIQEKISLARAHITALHNSPDWGVAPEVQSATAAWNTETDALDANEKVIADLLNKLAAARTTQGQILARWITRKQGVLVSVTSFCDGLKAKIQAFGFSLAGRQPHIPATVPEGLQGKRSEMAGAATVVWTTRRGIQGYMVQSATDPANTATYAAPIVCSRGKFQLTGQTPGATIHFRVLALDATLPTGQTAYTQWVAVTVSS